VAWTTNTPNSRIFQQAMLNPIARAVNAATIPTGFVSLTADTINVALWNNSITPDATVAVASTGYNTGAWASGANEVTDATNWVAGGRALGAKTFSIDTGSSSAVFNAPNLAGGGNVTLTNAYGCLVYDNLITAGTVAKQGMCYNYFGGAQSVTNGTFTIIWATVGATTGIFNITV
jgi:hypothetical protein